MALGNMPVAYFNQRGFCRSKSDSARRGKKTQERNLQT